MSDDRLFKFILRCNRHKDTPDLHSFKIAITGGVAFVECRGFEVYVEAHTKTIERFVGTDIAVTNFLEKRGADYESIEM